MGLTEYKSFKSTAEIPNKNLATHSHATLDLNKGRQLVVSFLMTALTGEKSAPLNSALSTSNNEPASLFYGFMLYRFCLSLGHEEICTSHYILKCLHETKKENVKGSDLKAKGE